ncbi:MAG: hypothetical protein ACRBFS_09135 [Aureispira sp.]
MNNPKSIKKHYNYNKHYYKKLEINKNRMMVVKQPQKAWWEDSWP